MQIMALSSMMKDDVHTSSGSSPPSQSSGEGEKLRRMGKGTRLPAGCYLLLVSLLVAVTVSALVQPLNANPTCILNCAQCVKIYGEFFDGNSCAKVCMESRSRFESFVDCADPTTIARFLKAY